METNYKDFETSAEGSANYRNLWYSNSNIQNEISTNPLFIMWQKETVTNATITEHQKVLPLTNMSHGDTVENRIGRKVIIRRVHIDAILSGKLDGDNDITSHEAVTMPRKMTVQFVLVRHRASSGNVPDPTHIYVSKTMHAGGTLLTTSVRDKQYSNQYDIVKKFKKTLTFDIENNNTVNEFKGNAVNVFSKVIYVNKYCTYVPNQSDGFPEDHQDGGLYLLAFTYPSNTQNAGIHITFSANARVFFIDV